MTVLRKVFVSMLFMIGSVQSACTLSAQTLQQAPGFYRATLGSFTFTALSDGTAPRDMAKILSKPDVATLQYDLDHEKEPIALSINAYVINTGSHWALIDTGAGELFGETSGKLIVNMKASGIDPKQIDIVLLTHIHADHSGGLTVGGTMQFPNATVYVDKRDVDLFVNRSVTPADSPDLRRIVAQSQATVGPYLRAGKIVFIAHDGQIIPGIESRSQPGHTPGHTAYIVESSGHKILFWGDIVHAAEVQFARPDITVQYDIDLSEAAIQRLREFQFAADSGIVVASDHISFPGLGHVRKLATGYAWLPVPYSAIVNEIDPK
jgi:glyoxylase-like metal-dependent hydrolase (beta-lactamase superfamily II)